MLIRNTAANFVGQLVYPLLALALVPFYIRHLGLEGYGLVGLMALIVSLLSVFSRGAGAALQREISRRRSDEFETLPRLVHSMEVLYLAVGATMALAVVLLTAIFGPGWVRSSYISAETVTVCLLLLSLRVAAAFPLSVYHSVFVGSERQVLGSVLNALLAVSAAISGALGVLISGSVVAVYAAESLTAAVFLLVYRRAAFRVLPAGEVRFDAAEVRALFRMSTALVWTSGVGLLLGNLDRVVVSVALPLAALGVYTVAVMAGRLTTLFFAPFLQAAYPRMCQIARTGSAADQGRDLMRNMAVLLVIVSGFGIPLVAFTSEVLAVWVRNPQIAVGAAEVTSLYVVATIFIGFASVFYQWQTATGRTRTAVRFNAVALLWFPPVLWVLVTRAGLRGAAVAWLAYGGLAWVTNLVSTFGRDGLPLSIARDYFRLTSLTLVPSLGFAIGARIIANYWFADSLAGRVGCGAAAGVCGGLAALLIVMPRLGHVPTATLQAAAVHPELSHGGL